MTVEKLVKSVRNDAEQGAFDKEEILSLCGHVEKLIKEKEDLKKYILSEF